MNSRPQFSLRRLLVVTLLVCLAAATLNEPPEGEQLMRGAKALLRAALCVTFAAVLTVGATRTDGYRKSFYIGGAAAAALPLLVLVESASGSLVEPPFSDNLRLLPGRLMAGLENTSSYRWWFVKWWASAPVFGLTAVGFDWMFRISTCRNGAAAALTTRVFFARGALFMLIATCLATIAAMPEAANGRLALTQSWLAEALCVLFCVMVAVGVVQGDGYFKVFCIGGLLPSVLAVVWLYVSIMIFVAYQPAETAFGLADGERLTLAAHWALIPVLGTAFAFCDWLLRRGTRGPKNE